MFYVEPIVNKYLSLSVGISKLFEVLKDNTNELLGVSFWEIEI